MADRKQAMLEKFFQSDRPGELIIAYDRDGTFVPPRSYLSFHRVEPIQGTSADDFQFFLITHIQETYLYAYCPNLLIEQYGFPSMKEVPPPQTMPYDRYIREKLLPYVREKGIEPNRYVMLRNAVYARRRGLDLACTINQQYVQITDPFDYLSFVNRQSELQQAYNNNPVTQLPIHAIQTAQGMLFFSNSEIGRQGIKQFYQELADRYFLVAKDPGPVREYVISYNSWNLNALVDRCYRKEEDGIYRFQFDDNLYDHTEVPSPLTWKPTMEITTKATSSDFLNLIENTGCRISEFNNNIWRLLYLTEHGFNRNIIMDKQFVHNSVFYELAKKVDNCFNSPNPEGKDNLFTLLDKLHTKADIILRTQYDIRDHRSLEHILSDPDNDPKVRDIRLTFPMRQVLLKGNNLYLPVFDHLHPHIHFLTADLVKGCLRLSEKPFPGKTFQDKEGKIVPYENVRPEKIQKSTPVPKKKKQSHKL